MMENRILSAILTSRSNYETVVSALDGEPLTGSFSPVAKAAAEILEEYYTLDPAAQSCSREVLLDRAAKKAHNPHYAKALEDFCNGLEESVSVPNLVRDIRDHRRHRIGDKIAGLLANRDESSELDNLLTQYQSLRGETDVGASEESELFHNVPVTELLDRKFSTGTIPFALECLNRVTEGGVRAGHHLLIYGRPELGKSLLALDLTAGWLGLGYRVMYVENEEPLSDTTIRLIGRLCRRPRADIFQYPEKAQQKIDESGYGNFIGVSLAPGNLEQIGRLVDKHSPQIVVVNQLRNLDVGDTDGPAAAEKQAAGIRNLAKSRGVLALSVTQAGESAEGKSFLELSDIYGSKTGVPGAIDLAIGIGASAEDKRFNIRTLSTPKNKLGGEHANIAVRIDPRTGVVEELQR